MNFSGYISRKDAESYLYQIDPYYTQRWKIYDGILKRLTGPETKWLDGGCGNNIAIEEFPCKINIGMDVYRHPNALHTAPNHLVLGNMENIPFKSNSFTLITLNTVAEHFQQPDLILKEIHRVLCPGGYLLIHTTNKHSPLIMMGNLVPERLRMKLLKKGFGAHEPDVFKAYHKLNSIAALKNIPGFELKELYSIQDLNWTNRYIFFLLLGYHMISKLPGLWRIRTNLIALLQKI
ncbi:MAG: methyltransferase domain-containing protein [Candidatus Latescibacteria bacterium]|nr:methyltransferase domain-containing protein [Candidatus Latescibacterota bacterium]